MSEINTIKINEIEYVRKDSLPVAPSVQWPPPSRQ